MDICAGLTSTYDEVLMNRLLDTIKDVSAIRTQDTFRWLVHLLRNRKARSITWKWLRDNWSWVDENFKGDKSYDEYPRYVAMSLRTEEQLMEYRDFFEPMKSDPALVRVIDMGINEIRNRIDLLARDSEAVRQALINL